MNNLIKPFFSICIPCYEMKGLGATYLKWSFEMLKIQTFTDFEIVVADHSIDNSIERICQDYTKYFPITYLKNSIKRGNSSANINVAISHAKGKWLKILFQDDYLINEHSLMEHFEMLKNESNKWFACGTEHTQNGQELIRPHEPSYHSKIYLGKNTIGAPSNITFPNNENPELFDEKLIWLMDCEFYRRLELRYGWPILSPKILIVNRIGDHQVTNTLIHDQLVRREERYVKWKNLLQKLSGWIGYEFSQP